MHGASATQRHAAAELRAGHAQHVAQHPKKWRVAVDVNAMRLTVDYDGEGHGVLSFSTNGDLRRDPRTHMIGRWRHDYNAHRPTSTCSHQERLQPDPDRHKYAYGSGWPSFTGPIVEENVSERIDDSHGMHRVEVRSKHGNSHPGHVFTDGPSNSTGMRYCINPHRCASSAGGYGSRRLWRPAACLSSVS